MAGASVTVGVTRKTLAPAERTQPVGFLPVKIPVWVVAGAVK